MYNEDHHKRPMTPAEIEQTRAGGTDYVLLRWFYFAFIFVLCILGFAMFALFTIG